MVYLKIAAVAVVAWVVYLALGPSQDYAQLTEERVNGKNVLITGSSAGLGEELAYTYAKLGANVFITARREKALQQVIEKCKALGPPNRRHGFVSADMTRPDQYKSLIQKAVNFLGGLDYLILNHAYFGEVGFWAGTPSNMSAIRLIMEGCFTSYVQLASDALPHLEATNGSMAVMSSMGGELGSIISGAYNSAKHAVNGFFRTLRSELSYRHVNVSITLVILGAMDNSHWKVTESEMCLILGHPPGCLDSYAPPAPLELVANDVITSTALRQFDVWCPKYLHGWLWKLFYHTFPVYSNDLMNSLMSQK